MERNEQCVVKTTIFFVAIFQKTNKQKHSLTRKFVFLGNIVLIHRYMFSFVLSHVFWIVRISLINNIKHEASSNHSTTDYFQQCNKMLTVQYISIYWHGSLILSYDELKMEYGPIKCIRSGHMSGRS